MSARRGTRQFIHGRANVAALVAAFIATCAALGLTGCARREPPTGGPPDLAAPRLIHSDPDSGRAGVPTDAHVSLTFSEGMDPVATGDAVQVSPPVTISKRRWSGNTLTIVFGDTLRSGHTYTVFVGTTARDRHNNDLTAGTSVVFSTGATFPAGRIEGEVEAHGFAGPGTYLWCYHAERTGVPDSTARDFDAVGLVDEKSEFRIDGLTVPGRYRLWAFADINANRSFEPDRDFLAPVDTTFELTEAHPVAGPVHVRLRNPRAPGTIVGAVIDSLHDSLGVTRIIAIGAVDSTLRVLADINPDRTFEMSLRAGPWELRAFQDEDRSNDWNPSNEPAGPPVRVELEAAGKAVDVRLMLPPVPRAP